MGRNKRQATREELNLPVTERLLADKPEHLFTRNESELIASDNPWGFKLRCRSTSSIAASSTT